MAVATQELSQAGPPVPVYMMSKYHATTHSTDRELTPVGVLKLSSGDCRDLLSSNEDDDARGKREMILAGISKAPQCKVTWGTALSRRKQHIEDILAKFPEAEGKLFCATPFEEAHATALSCKMHEGVKNVHIMVAFGGSCLHILSVNQVGDVLRPGPNVVSRGLPRALREALRDVDDLQGTDADWIPGCKPPMIPDKDTLYTTFPLDSGLSSEQYLCIVKLFEELNALMTQTQGASFLVCGAPTNINPEGSWWPDRTPRMVKTSFKELAEHSALRQVKNNETGIVTGGLLCERHQVKMKGTGRITTIHELVLTAMATPHLKTPEYFGTTRI